MRSWILYFSFVRSFFPFPNRFGNDFSVSWSKSHCNGELVRDSFDSDGIYRLPRISAASCSVYWICQPWKSVSIEFVCFFGKKHHINHFVVKLKLIFFSLSAVVVLQKLLRCLLGENCITRIFSEEWSVRRKYTHKISNSILFCSLERSMQFLNSNHKTRRHHNTQHHAYYERTAAQHSGHTQDAPLQLRLSNMLIKIC